MNKKIINFVIPLILLILVLATAYYFFSFEKENKEIQDYLDTEISDDTCTTDVCEGPDETSLYEDDVVLETPESNELVGSPLTIRGKAKGTWFFEGSFPIILTDWDGLVIAESYASAQSDWMTEDYVDFVGTLEFAADTSVSERGALILQKANPSGLPENDGAYEIKVRFE